MTSAHSILCPSSVLRPVLCPKETQATYQQGDAGSCFSCFGCCSTKSPKAKAFYHTNGHRFMSQRVELTAVCDHCHKRLWNLKRKAQICIFCDIVVHKKCRVLVSQCGEDKKDEQGSAQEKHVPETTQDEQGSADEEHVQETSPSKDEQGSAHVIQVRAQVHAPESSPSNEPPSHKIEDFDFIKFLGKGCFGKVHLVRSKTDQQEYALKAVSKKRAQKNPETFWTERVVLSQTSDCPFLVTMTSCFQTPTKFYAAEMSLGLQYLHQCNIIHRDLKVDNILLDAEGHIKITDFGISKIFFNEKQGTRTPCGMFPYVAPEILMKKVYGFAVDWWALGLVLFEMATLTHPFTDDIIETGSGELIDAIISEPANIPDDVSVDLYMLLDGFLCKDPAKRLGCWPEPGFLFLQCHPFFEGLDWEMAEKKMLPPPYKPDFEEHNDEFEESRLSPVEQEELDEIDQNEFSGFDYVV
ncbi:protein kinase C zeta type-like [Rhinophrynus dorsalis]